MKGIKTLILAVALIAMGYPQVVQSAPAKHFLEPTAVIEVPGDEVFPFDTTCVFIDETQLTACYVLQFSPDGKRWVNATYGSGAPVIVCENPNATETFCYQSVTVGMSWRLVKVKQR